MEGNSYNLRAVYIMYPMTLELEFMRIGKELKGIRELYLNLHHLVESVK